MRPGSKARRDELRESLIDAAEHWLSEAGLAALNVRQLAADAGCGAGTISYMFGSLDNLILLANERTLAQIASSLEDTLAPGHGGARPEQMEALALAYLDYAQANRNRWEALFLHRVPDGVETPDWYAQRRDALIARIAGIVHPSAPASDIALHLARTIFEAVHGVVLLGLDRKLGGSADDELRKRVVTLTHLLAAGLTQAGIAGPG